MINLIKKVIKYQKIYKKYHYYDSELFKEIALFFEPLILKILKKIKNKINKDIYQEMIIKLNYLIIKFDIKKYDYDIKYIKNYIEEKKTKKEKIIYYEYNLFCNQNQLLKYVKRSLLNFVIDIVRKNEREKKKIILKDFRVIDNYEKEINFKKDPLEKLTNSQKEFVFSFLDKDNNVLSERDVAKKLGITQQAVNKRKAKIKKILKNF